MDNCWLRTLQHVMFVTGACFAVASAVWMRPHKVHKGSTHLNHLRGGHTMMRYAKFTLSSVLGDLLGLRYHGHQKLHLCHSYYFMPSHLFGLCFPWLFTHPTFENLWLLTCNYSTVTKLTLRKTGGWRNSLFLMYIHDSIEAQVSRQHWTIGHYNM